MYRFEPEGVHPSVTGNRALSENGKEKGNENIDRAPSSGENARDADRLVHHDRLRPDEKQQVTGGTEDGGRST